MLDSVIVVNCTKNKRTPNVVIAYNSMMLSALLTRYQADGNHKVLNFLKKISTVAWQHIHFLGHYAFRDHQHPIDLETLLAGVTIY